VRYIINKRIYVIINIMETNPLPTEEELPLQTQVMGNGSREQTQIQDINDLLAQAAALLIDPVDYGAPLKVLAQLTVPHLADWCVIHLSQANGPLEQVALAPEKGTKQMAVYGWLQNHLLNDVRGTHHSGIAKLASEMELDSEAEAVGVRSMMMLPLTDSTQTLGVVTFVSAESGRRFDQHTLSLAENFVRHISVYLEKAKLYQESQRLKAELEQRVSERTAELREAVMQLKASEATVQSLFRISNELNATLDVDTILDELAQEAIRIVNGESGFAGLRTAEGMSVRKYFHKGEAISFEYTWPVGKGIPGWVLQHKVPYGTSEAASDPMMLHELLINTDVRSIICTPILDSSGEVLGYFDIRDKQDAEGFTISDQEMLMALAPAASIAIQNALAYQQSLGTVSELKESSGQLRALAADQELAREEERTRIARELHDQLGQALTVMKLDLAWVIERLAQKDPALQPKAKSVMTQMDTMIKTVRRIATELRPGMLEDLGLAASIEWQARDFQKRTGIKCKVNILSEEFPPASAESLALFRIFQEALTNITRHARAKQVDVKLDVTLDALTLEVRDDGQGIQAHEISDRRSLGLLGMQERAKRLGGSFNIRGKPGKGTTLTVSIPISKINDVN
jgi:signal transduction histidine kinase